MVTTLINHYTQRALATLFNQLYLIGSKVRVQGDLVQVRQIDPQDFRVFQCRGIPSLNIKFAAGKSESAEVISPCC